jgi:catechol 2,3-dioxygenase-like lactoylglutathione lyase family enzyme
VQVLQSRVLLRPADFDAAVAFYEQRLGLVRYRDWGAPGHRGVVYFLGGGFLELTEGGRHVRPAGVRLWLQVADIAAARDELATAGVTILAEPERKPWGLHEMEIAAPDGLVLVVVETPVDHPLRRRSPSG